MSGKVKAVRLSDLKDHVQFREPEFAKWDSVSLRLEITDHMTSHVVEWIDARAAELVREKVPRDQITIRTDGARTTVFARGVARFQLKVKIGMEVCDGR